MLGVWVWGRDYKTLFPGIGYEANLKEQVMTSTVSLSTGKCCCFWKLTNYIHVPRPPQSHSQATPRFFSKAVLHGSGLETGLGLSIIQYMEKAGQWEGLQMRPPCCGVMYHDERKWCVILKCDLEV